MKRCPARGVALIAVLSFALLGASAYAQFQTGNIYGKVQAKDGSVLPGVTVTLTGVGAPQRAVTDARGDFRFLGLSPGTYSLRADLEGFGTATRAGISVNVAQNADVTITLMPAVSETISVTAEGPLLDIRKAGTGINVTKVELEKIPTSRDPWTILQQVPSVQVDRINVGGNQSGQQSLYLAKGADPGQNTWNVDGVNITDMWFIGASLTYYDFDAFEEMQITTGGSDPRIMTPGVQLNMVTRRGTNDWRGSGRYFYTPGSYQAEPTVPVEAATYLARTNRINFVRDYGAELGGPLWKDYLWFWVARGDQKISTQESEPPGTTAIPDKTILRNKNAKLNGQLLPNNSAVALFSEGDKVRNARGLGPQRPFETALHQSSRTKIYKLEDTQIFGSSFYLTGMWSKLDAPVSLIPNGGIGLTAPVPFRDLQNVWHKSFSYDIIAENQKQYRLDASKFFDIGHVNHEFKFGFGYRETPTTSTSGWAGPINGVVRYRPASFCSLRGVPATPQCMSVRVQRETNIAIAQKYSNFLLSDTILMGNLIIQAGLRWDQQKANNAPSSSPANPLIGEPITLPYVPGGTLTAQLPALSFAGDRTLRWRTVEPRLGATYALGANKKTLLRAAYNRYADQMSSFVHLANPNFYSYFLFVGNDRNGDQVPQRDELVKIVSFGGIDPAHPSALNSPTRVDYGMTAPRTDEYIAGIERELITDFSVGFNYTFRKYHNLRESRAEHHQGTDDFFTPADYIVAGQATVTLPDGRKFGPVTYYDLKNPSDVPTFFVVRNRPDYTRSFNGFELTAIKRLSRRWMLRGNFSYNDWKDQCGANASADPTPTLDACHGGQVVKAASVAGPGRENTFVNARWTYSVTLLYELPRNIHVGANLSGREGYPAVHRDTVTTAPGATLVILNPVGSVRFSNVYELDLRAAKDFHFLNRVGLTLAADLFNVPNQRTIIQRETVIGQDNEPTSNANNITEIQSPRVWRFSARFNF